MTWDVAVAGAGPAGAVAALVLSRSGRRVVLIDQPVEVGRKVGECLPGAARPLLRDLGLLARVEDGPHLPSYGTLSAWGSDELRTTDSLADPHGPGWHLDRLRFDADLRAAAREAGVAFEPGLVRSVERAGEAWRISCRRRGGREETATVLARFLVDATGRRATVARSLGVRRRRDHRLVALCAWTRPTGGADARTLVEAAPDGWWYSAGLPDGGRVVVLHVDGGEAASILRNDGAWQERQDATRHVRQAVGAAGLSAPPRATEACGACLDRFAGDGWLAVGDAALSFDPLSSQGLLDALYTGLRGAETAGAFLDGSRAPVGSYAARLASVRNAYLHHHRLYYSAEHRWLDRPFWASRVTQGGPPRR